jgi:predicted RNase H-like HicB family nuclease
MVRERAHNNEAVWRMAMASGLIVVTVAYDPEAGVWYVESSDLAGVNAEASTPEELREKLPNVILDLLEAADGAEDDGDLDVPIEIIAHMRTRVRRRACA